MRLKYSLINVSLILWLIGVLAACGISGSTADAGEPTATIANGSTPTATDTSESTPVASVTPTSTGSSSTVIVSTGKVPGHQSVGSMLTVLTTLQGLTLYIHRSQGASGFDCTDACAQKWHPLLFNGSGTPTSTTQLPGTLSKGTDAEGRMIVFYQGYPLYTNVANTAPGQNNVGYADNDPWQPAEIDISPENNVPSN